MAAVRGIVPGPLIRHVPSHFTPSASELRGEPVQLEPGPLCENDRIAAVRQGAVQVGHEVPGHPARDDLVARRDVHRIAPATDSITGANTNTASRDPFLPRTSVIVRSLPTRQCDTGPHGSGETTDPSFPEGHARAIRPRRGRGDGRFFLTAEASRS